MPDPFTNARAYLDPTFPSSGDGFSIAGFRNIHMGLGFLDVIPLQPRAHNPADRSIMIRGQDASGYFNPVYAGNADQRIPFSSGDTANFAIPVSNPRIDIIYMTPSGDKLLQQGTESVNPTLPSLSPSGDSRFPIAAVWCKPGMTKIVNFEDKDSNSGDGYIYKDLRPWMRGPGAGATSLTNSATADITGDSAVGSASTAARADHHHKGTRTVKCVGSGDMFGDIEIYAPDCTQGQSRINIGQQLMAKAWVIFDGRSGGIFESYNVASVVKNGTGNFNVNWIIPMLKSKYCVQITCGGTSQIFTPHVGAMSQGSVNLAIDNTVATNVDSDTVCVTVFGPQA